jgi:L-lactate utilization protein LutC
LNKTLSAEQAFTQQAAHSAANPEVVSQQDRPTIMLKRIGSTTYEVSVYFSNTSKETMNDKISRLIRNESDEKAVVGQ